MCMKKCIINILNILNIIFKYVPYYGILSIIDSILSTLVNICFNLILIRIVADKVIEGYGFYDIIPYVYYVYLLIIIASIVKFTKSKCLKPLAVNKLYNELHAKIFDKAVSIDLACFDNVQFYNEFFLSIKNIDTKIMELFEYIIRLLFLVLTLSGTIAVIFTLSPIYLLICMISILINWLSISIKNKYLFTYDVEMNNLKRQSEYINRLFYLSDYIKEIKIFNLKDSILKKFRANVDTMRKTITKYQKKFIIIGILVNFVADSLIIDGLLIIKLSFDVLVKKTLSVGSVISIIKGVSNLQWILQDLIEVLGDIHINTRYIDKYNEFINKENVVSDGDKELILADENIIEFKNVWFKYNSQDEYVLKDINLKISSNEKIALVGRNGAGKSTLIKLLLRFYDVSKGEILFNGVNIKEFKLDEYRKIFSPVFQNYNMYAATIEENISMDICNEYTANVNLAITSVGLDNKFNNSKLSLKSYLNKEIYDESVDLSGGEKQKIAISRAIARKDNSEIFIFDEPNSYLDAISEYEITRTINKIFDHKITITISHRLGNIQESDCIYVLDNGSIKEYGKHEELISKNGLYAHMYNAQAKRYIFEKKVG
mgnify:CR=1 FL=1